MEENNFVGGNTLVECPRCGKKMSVFFAYNHDEECYKKYRAARKAKERRAREKTEKGRCD